MGRIKQGLDYFPLNTDFMHDRVVRRVMKREGDSAFTILLYTLSYLYSGEGYYIHVDDDFYDELSDQLFSTDNDSVRRVLRLFVEYGFFDSSLYERYGILTSADIQRQFLFITKRRSRRHISPDYCLLPDEETVHSTLPDAVAETPDTATKGLYEMARLLFHFHGYQDGNRWSTSWTWNHAPVSHRQYGKPCDPFGSCFDFCASVWHCICLACCTGWLVCKFFDFLCGTQEELYLRFTM